MSRKCAIGGCRTTTDDDKLMCHTHWDMVPRDMQGKIYELNAVRIQNKLPTYKPHMDAIVAALMHVRQVIDGKTQTRSTP